MTIKDRIQAWLGITDLRVSQYHHTSSILSLSNKLDRVANNVSAFGPGLGRIIAKLDPDYAKDELDPARRAASDKLSDETIRRLQGEALARDHTTGEL